MVDLTCKCNRGDGDHGYSDNDDGDYGDGDRDDRDRQTF